MFSDKQFDLYKALLYKAWAAECANTGDSPNDSAAANIFMQTINLQATGLWRLQDMDRTKDFDAVMLRLAIIAADEFWIDRIAQGDERRIRFVIHAFLEDLELLEKQKITWAYVVAIFEQMKLPKTMEECPAELLIKVMFALDTQIRRLAKKQRFNLVDLPSHNLRRGMPAKQAKAKYRHGHHHRRQHAVA